MKSIANHSSTSLRRHDMAGRRYVEGFTLIEVMITVAIVAILAAIAYGSYQNQIVRTRRAAGATCLQERAQTLERFYTTSLTYAGAANPAPCADNVSQHYAVSFVAAPTARAYTLRAVPQGVQATRDTLCGTLTINQQGIKTENGTAGTAAECW